MLPLENYLFSATGPKPNQDTIPAGVTLAGDFGFCFQCQVGSSLVLHRPIEITALIRTLIKQLLDPSLSVVGQFDFHILSNSATPAIRIVRHTATTIARR